jgi:hypothetical protein
LKDKLAERLLATVQNWRPQDTARERLGLQAMATYRYDEYQQFSPGMRFVESLALWLKQFDSGDERKAAYELVRNKLIYVSSSQMAHLVATSYAEVVKPVLIRTVSGQKSIPEWNVRSLARSVEFETLLRQSLFFGLSDGSHIDLFRRANGQISNEQIRLTYEVSARRASEMQAKLSASMHKGLQKATADDENRFRLIFLLDDFSASGLSYIRQENEEFTGKVAKFFRSLSNEELAKIVDPDNLRICLILYVATDQALRYLVRIGAKLSGRIPFEVRALYRLDSSTRVTEDHDPDFFLLMKKYYDPSIETEDYLKGKHDNPFLGFDECALPLVLSHNTPNNSVPLLWFGESGRIRGLFPRVSRFPNEHERAT